MSLMNNAVLEKIEEIPVDGTLTLERNPPISGGDHGYKPLDLLYPKQP